MHPHGALKLYRPGRLPRAYQSKNKNQFRRSSRVHPPPRPGNRLRNRANCPDLPAHPRLGGEQRVPFVLQGVNVGSSPRGGNSGELLARGGPGEVHPRVRGEQRLRRPGR